MNLKYIYHSSFLIELSNCNLLFDYYKMEIPKLDKEKKLYVFSSHGHRDHYNEEIFEIFREFKDVSYILSDDIIPSKKDYCEKTFFISANNKYSFDDMLEIETYESTDEGIALMLNIDNKVIYHAGDLNWWTWVGFESDEEFELMTRRYKEQIDKMRGKKIDLAMVVLDPRQGERFDWGLKCFLETTDTKYVAPMHCWDKYYVIDDFRKKHSHLCEKTVIIDTEKTTNGYKISL